ncbi:MAG: Do family serine endopeptidase [Terriglobales bacterium]
MNSSTPSVFSRISGRTKIFAAAVIVLAVTASASAGFIHLPGISPEPAPMVATMKPLAPDVIAPLEALNRATEAVTGRVLPTVVEIQVEGRSKSQMSQMVPQNLPGPFRQFFFQFGTPQRRSSEFIAVGSGIIISPSGYIVTNNHVVKDASKVQVTLNNQHVYPAKVVGTDAATDLAVIKINAPDLTSADFGDSSLLRPGEMVLAIGAPLDQQFTVTSGIISALNRSRSQSNGPNSRGNFIQTDAPINHGNSGGPLVNVQGQVIGINTEMMTSQNGYADIGFAIPSNLVKSVAADLIKNGKVIRGYLGIDVTPLSPDTAASLHEPNASGVLVDQVNADSPAAKAGIKPYDVVTSFNGSKITNGGDLQVVAGSAAPGTTAKVGVVRDGKPMTFDVTMGNYANAPASGEAAPVSPSSSGTPKLGITVTPLTPQLRSQLQLPDSLNGLLVQSVQPNSPAMIAGLSRGDVIEQANQHPIASAQELEKQIEATPPGSAILLMVHQNGSDFILPISPER